MKKFKIIYIVLFLVTLGSQATLAQKIGDLKGINYQAVAIDQDGKEIIGKDVTGKPLYEKTIGVRFSILSGSSTGAVLYQETHTTLTDQYGLFSLVIGLGTSTGSGQFTKLMDIPWIDANQFLNVEISIKNDGNYKLVSSQQFMSVPYSYYTDDIADNAITTDKILDGTILNADVANKTIDLTAKVTGILPVANGGTGTSSLTNGGVLVGGGTGPITSLGVAQAGQIPVGTGTAAPALTTLTAGAGIVITNAPGSITITSAVTGINSQVAGNVQIGSPGTGSCSGAGRELPAGTTWISPSIPLTGATLGNIVIGSVNDSLNGCMMSTYVRSGGQIEVSIFNGTPNKVCFISNAQLKVLIVQ